jgi:hypothetical protein
MFIRRFLSGLPEPMNLSLASLAVLFLFALVMCLSFVSPVYYDDIRYPLGNSRILYDGFGSISTTPYCTSTFYSPYPLVFAPARFLSGVIHSLTGNFMVMRLYGLLVFLAWAAYMTWFIRRYIMPHWPWLYASAAVAAVSGMGAVPILLLGMRPDVGFLLCVTFFVSLPFIFRQHRQLSRRHQACFFIGILLVISWCFSAHPKTMLYLPLMLIASAYVPFERKGIRYALIGCILLLTAISNAHWSTRTKCPDDITERQMRYSQAVNPEGLINMVNAKVDGFLSSNAGSQRSLFDAANELEQSGLTLKEQLGNYALMLGFAVSYIFAFLSTLVPIILLNDLNSFTYVRRMLFYHSIKWRLEIEYNFLTAIADIAISMLALYILFIIVKSIIWVVRTSTRADLKEPRFVILFTLLGCMLLQAGVQVAKNFYELPFVWPCLFLFCMVLVSLPYWRQAMLSQEKKHLLALLLVSIISQLVFLVSYGPLTVREYKVADANGVLASNDILISPFNYGDTAERIVALAARCGITNDSASQHVMVDPLSYTAMRASFRPFLYRMTYREEVPDPPEKIFRLLQEQDSSGIVMQCRYIPQGQRDLALEDNGLCCMSREAVRSVQPNDKPAY